MWDLMCQKIITINQLPTYNSVNYRYQMVSLPHCPEAHRTLIWGFLATNTHLRAMQYMSKSNTTGICIRPTVHDLHLPTHSNCSLSQTDYTV